SFRMERRGWADYRELAGVDASTESGAWAPGESAAAAPRVEVAEDTADCLRIAAILPAAS
ncbi:hypothetical protein P0D69_15630, partial [Paraburkholderia sediminicola]